MCAAPTGFPYITADGLVTDDMIAFYELRARGGAAAVTVSEALTHSTGRSHGRVIDLTADGVLQGLTDLARAIRRHGAVASIELNHSGIYAEMDIPKGERDAAALRYGPSVASLPGGRRAAKMTQDMIAEIVKSFGDAAALCKRAGFDMVMIHGGHGWLIEQFLSPAINHRGDEYGGSPKKRARLAIEIIDSVRAAVGPGFPIEFRMSGVENMFRGYNIDDAVAFAALIEDKIDLLHVSAGFGEVNFDMTHPSMFAPHGVNVHLAAAVKKRVRVPVATVGALGEPDMMEEIIASGAADVVCMARALLADPELPRKVVSNRSGEILRCLRCLTCHTERTLTQTRICAVNPIIGRENESRFARPPAAPKRVLVAGGGPSGMTAALTAARRGHKVILCERSDALGGALRAGRDVPFKHASFDFIRNRELMMRLAGVDIMLGVEVTPGLVRSISPDALIVAVGSEHIIPDIPGADGANVFTASELPDVISKLGEAVAVLGGGLAGCESALNLALTGRHATLVEMGPEFAPDANPRHRPILLRILDEDYHIKMRANMRATAVSARGLHADAQRGVRVLFEVDAVIIAAGMKPRLAAADALRSLAPETAFVGDCVSVKNIREAVFRGYHAALDL
jgi:2,4-dienoyl-CoA reductase-like NADH-dependent reductase (Old Yellow Enzyme family)/thioredoxin reductase